MCDHFLYSFSHEEIGEVLKIIVSKMRLKSELTIIQPDITILSQKLSREEITEKTLNNILFTGRGIKSVASAEIIQTLNPANLQGTQKHFDITTSNITIKARRVQ